MLFTTSGDEQANPWRPGIGTTREGVLGKHVKVPPPQGAAGRLLEGVTRFGPTRTAVLGAAVCAVLGVLGVLDVLHLIGAFGDRWFDLDGERTIPSLWSAGLLFGAGLLGVAVAVALRRPAVIVLGAALAFMAVDEFFALHEHVEDIAGVDWQTLYLPVFAVIGVVTLRVLLISRRLGEHRFVTLLTSGAACWAASQVLEKIQWNGPERRAGYDVMMVSEELLEMTGSLLFVLALLALALARTRRTEAAPAAPADTAATAATTPLSAVARR